MKTYFKIRATICAAFCFGLLAFYFSPQMQAAKKLPNTIYVQSGQQRFLHNISKENVSIDGSSVSVRSSSDERFSEKENVQIDAKENGDSKVKIKVFGIPVREITVRVSQNRILAPGGQSIGVTMHTQGALVVGTGQVVNGSFSVNPAKKAGIEAGDVIRSINKIEIEDADHLSEIVNRIKDETLELGVQREGTLRYMTIKPEIDTRDGKKRLGLWVRDSTAGVGTLSFYDPQTQFYGALGHAITDVDTKQKLNVRNGQILNSRIIDVKQSSKGEPGELKGNFSSKDAIGSIEKNTEFGIFGKAYSPIVNPLYPNGLPIALQDQVEVGPATILTTVDGNGMQEFNCEIIRIQTQSAPAQRGMIISITDKRLIEITGGIVQGMSGSTILQNGKIVGAVTHVFVNDPTKGYGIFIEWMLSECES